MLRLSARRERMRTISCDIVRRHICACIFWQWDLGDRSIHGAWFGGDAAILLAELDRPATCSNQ